jgi:hypothetical protein
MPHLSVSVSFEGVTVGEPIKKFIDSIFTYPASRRISFEFSGFAHYNYTLYIQLQERKIAQRLEPVLLGHLPSVYLL